MPFTFTEDDFAETAEAPMTFTEADFEEAAPVVRQAEPGTLEPQDLFPAVRKIGGALAIGEQGDTHPDIIQREGIPALDIDQRGFVSPLGFMDRESAANALLAPTAFEPGRLHSTDLSVLQEPGGYQKQLEKIAEAEAPQPLFKLPTAPGIEVTPPTTFEKITPGIGFVPPVVTEQALGKEAADLQVQVQREMYNVAKQLPEFLTTEEGVLGVLGSLVSPSLVGAAFLKDMAGGLIDQAKSSGENWDTMSKPEKARAIVNAAGTLGFAALLGKGMVKGVPAEVRAVRQRGISPMAAGKAPPTAPTGEAVPTTAAERTAVAGEVPKIQPAPSAISETKPSVSIAQVSPTEAPARRTLTPAVRSDDNPNIWAVSSSHADARLKLMGEKNEFSGKPQNEGFIDEKGNWVPRDQAIGRLKELTGIKEPKLRNAAGLSSEDFTANDAKSLFNLEQTMEATKQVAAPTSESKTAAAILGLPPTKPGMIRLYRGQGDATTGGIYWSSDPKYAITFGGNIQHVEVPRDVAIAGRKAYQKTGSGTPNAFIIDDSWQKKAQQLKVEVPVLDLDVAEAEAIKPASEPVASKPTEPVTQPTEPAAPVEAAANIQEAQRIVKAFLYKKLEATKDSEAALRDSYGETLTEDQKSRLSRMENETAETAKNEPTNDEILRYTQARKLLESAGVEIPEQKYPQP